jgi:hypothetical protein
MKPFSTRVALGALVLSLTVAGCLARTTDDPEGEVSSSTSALSRICGGPRHLRCGRNQVLQNGACAPKGPACGGIAARPCPGAGQCADDPSDNCDPNQGGADCGGICSCIETQLCVRGDHFDSDPAVCACVPDVTNPCAAVLCLAGTVCVAHADGTASCDPQP